MAEDGPSRGPEDREAPKEADAGPAPPEGLAQEAYLQRIRLAQDQTTEVLSAYSELQIESENYRERATEAIERRYFERRDRLLLASIGVLEKLDQAIDAAQRTGADDALVQGLILVRSLLLRAAQDEGLERVPVVGRPYEPGVCRAVASRFVDDPAQHATVVEELQAGIRIGGRLARSATVVVGVYPGMTPPPIEAPAPLPAPVAAPEPEAAPAMEAAPPAAPEAAPAPAQQIVQPEPAPALEPVPLPAPPPPAPPVAEAPVPAAAAASPAPVPEPVAAPAPEPVAAPAPEPVVAPAPEPVAAPAPEPVPALAPEPVPALAPEPVVAPAPEPVTEPPPPLAPAPAPTPQPEAIPALPAPPPPRPSRVGLYLALALGALLIYAGTVSIALKLFRPGPTASSTPPPAPSVPETVASQAAGPSGPPTLAPSSPVVAEGRQPAATAATLPPATRPAGPSAAPSLAPAPPPKAAAVAPPKPQPAVPATLPRPTAEAPKMPPAAAQVPGLLDQANAALAAQRYDEAAGLYDQALKLDPQNQGASAGRRRAIAGRELATRTFVTGRTVVQTPGAGRRLDGFDNEEVELTKAPKDTGRIAFEARPARPKPGETHTVQVYLTNEGKKSFKLSAITVTTTVNGTPKSGPVTPLATEVAQGKKVLLAEVAQVWEDDTVSWSLEAVVTTPRGEAFKAQLTWR